VKPLLLALLALAGLLLSWHLTGAAWRHALATELMDRPNARSSHSVATPRGGGVAIVASFLLLTLGLAGAGLVQPALAAAIVGAGLLVAGLGYADDRRPLPARWRFLGHVAAAAWVLGWMEPVPAMPLFGRIVDLGWAGPALCGLFLVWMINLFNFMDGIDGIASVEAITVCLAGALLWWLAGAHGSGAALALLFAACVAGFLLWNFPPARIFMGDAGSGFLGLVVALFALWCGQVTPALFWSWFILVGCFMVDATTTLLRRVRRGDTFHEAHRSHAYQYASRRHGGHRPVTLACGAINLLWLLPVAAAVALGWVDGLVGVAVAYAPLVWLAYHYKAGARELQGS
jgi:Fuc2NAc and GlcNAc transferase